MDSWILMVLQNLSQSIVNYYVNLKGSGSFFTLPFISAGSPIRLYLSLAKLNLAFFTFKPTKIFIDTWSKPFSIIIN